MTTQRRERSSPGADESAPDDSVGGVSVHGLGKRYGDRWVVDDLTFDVAQGQFLSIVGPSGCGKSTTLRLIAGLEVPDRGEVRIGSVLASSERKGVSIPVERRNVGFVFQSYALWPHMTVYEHLAYPLQARRSSKKDLRPRIGTILAIVGLEGLESRYASQLSGGQQQRVALARALVHEPTVMLLDEPLSNLDAQLRLRMGLELKALQAELGFTAVYVTHDRVEALSLSDRIMVLDHGKAVELGTPQEVYERPISEFSARFVSAANVVSGVVVRADASGVDVDLGGVIVTSRVRPRQPIGVDIGAPVLLSVRPESLVVLPDALAAASTATNVVAAQVLGVTYYGGHGDVVIRLLDSQLRAEVSADQLSGLSPGTSINVHLPPDSLTPVAPSNDWTAATAPLVDGIDG